jgi:hypothetical protein
VRFSAERIEPLTTVVDQIPGVHAVRQAAECRRNHLRGSEGKMTNQVRKDPTSRMGLIIFGAYPLLATLFACSTTADLGMDTDERAVSETHNPDAMTGDLALKEAPVDHSAAHDAVMPIPSPSPKTALENALQAMANEAGSVAHVRFRDITAVSTPEPGTGIELIHSAVHLEIIRNLTGLDFPDQITVLGGQLGETKMIFTESPPLEIGYYAIASASRDEAGKWQLQRFFKSNAAGELARGAFTLSSDDVIQALEAQP